MRNFMVLVFIAALFLSLTGCRVRTYPVIKERVDQELSGNQGYLAGTPQEAEKERKTTRTTQVIEIELPRAKELKKKILEYPPASTINKKGEKEPVQESVYLESEPSRELKTQEEVTSVSTLTFEKYTIRENDTLEKISQKFYGTTKKWTKIYQANKDILKSPNRIYPGQVIKIPLETQDKP